MNITKNKTIIRTAMAALILVAFVGVAVFYNKYYGKPSAEVSSSFRINESPLAAANLSKQVRNATSKNLRLTFGLSSNGVPAKLTSQATLNSRPDSQQLKPGQYILQIGNQGGQGYTTNFSSPLVIGESFAKSGKITPKHIGFSDSYSLIVPWFPANTPLVVKDAKGAVILRSTVKHNPLD